MNNIEKLKNPIQLYKERSETKDNFHFLSSELENLYLFNFGNEFVLNYRKDLLKNLENLNTAEWVISTTKDFAKATRTKARNSIRNNNTAQRYKKTFTYLVQEINPTDNLYEIIEQRLKIILTDKEYKLPYWGISSYAEVLSRIFPNYFIRFNSRNRTVSDYLNLQYKTNGYDWKQYISFQKEIAKPCFELYVKPDFQNIKDVAKSILIDDFFGFIYQTQIKNDKIDKSLDVNISIQAQLKKISIQNYYCIEDIHLPKLSKEIYIVGENGVGKTLLLQAIFWAAKRLLIENDPENTLGTAWIKRNFNQLEGLKIKLITDEIEDNIYQVLPIKDKKKEVYKRIQNFFAYGVNRQYQKGNDNTYEFMSLFSSEVETSLRNPMQWLQELKFQELEAEEENNPYHGIKLKTAISFLEKLLDNVTIQVSSKKVIFKEGESNSIDFNLLSDGYKSVFTWLADLLSRLAENQPNAEEVQDFKGVVLIDELDLFLHPKWSYNIVKQLREKLPNIQFIITTHSPILILGAGKDAIFYRMFKEDGISKILGPIENKNMSDKMANHIITAPFLFDLPTARQAAFDEKTQEVDTSDDYLASIIHKAIEKRLEQELKVNLMEDNIWKIANELLEQELEKR